MELFLLIMLLLAAAAGVLGAVLKVTLVIVFSFMLAVVLLAWIAAWYAKRRFRAFQRDVEVRYDQDRRRREAYDVRSEPRQGPARGLGDGS